MKLFWPILIFLLSIVTSQIEAQDYHVITVIPPVYSPPSTLPTDYSPTETETTDEVTETAATETTVTACALPYCEFGYDNCFSCTDCICNSPPTLTAEPESTTANITSCEQPDDPFCYTELFDGQCMTACCSFNCPGGIDWDYCESCFKCRCLPPPTEITDTTPCELQCEYQHGCSVHVNKGACRCEYDCSTVGPTRKPRTRKLKCGPA